MGPIGLNVAKDPRQEGQSIFWDFIILLDLSYNSEENETLFVKIGARAPQFWLDTSSGSKYPECSL